MNDRNIITKLELLEFFPYRLSILEQRVSQSVAKPYKDLHNLSRNDWRAMATLALLQPITATDIASFTKLEKMQVSRAVQRLKSEGLLVSQPDPEDKRAIYYRLSPKGVEIYNDIVPKVIDKERDILSCLTASERSTLKHLLDKVDAHLADQDR
ncbi:MarR family winged helix-turn-helix transcriptional regulator [Marinobacterium sp. YM272]|uniref:MarR family winged helix-turn-helix transcriptional regulator n=1 Tax=Marinobacterium sp. YM272 TaxID=3421654 RepID=UPI003D7F9EE3